MMDLNDTIQRLLLLIPPILLAVTMHELAHGWVAWKLGDPTAKNHGRLTLNPISHLDLAGTLVFFLTQTIGWAKPVPVNPGYFKNPRQGMVWVSLAGPLANIFLAVLSAFILKNLLGPISQMEAGQYFIKPILLMAYLSIQINIGLAVFNLLPIPPLDGSKVLMGLLPRDLAIKYASIERYGFIILLVLVFTGITGKIIVPLIHLANRWLIGPIL